MKVRELIERLQDVPQDWEVIGTGQGSLEIYDDSPEGYKFGYVFPDGRETRILTDRRKRALHIQKKKEKVNG